MLKKFGHRKKQRLFNWSTWWPSYYKRKKVIIQSVKYLRPSTFLLTMIGIKCSRVRTKDPSSTSSYFSTRKPKMRALSTVISKIGTKSKLTWNKSKKNYKLVRKKLTIWRCSNTNSSNLRACCKNKPTNLRLKKAKKPGWMLSRSKIGDKYSLCRLDLMRARGNILLRNWNSKVHGLTWMLLAKTSQLVVTMRKLCMKHLAAMKLIQFIPKMRHCKTSNRKIKLWNNRNKQTKQSLLNTVNN